ncbi:hypothetical protein JL100_000590 [Skermanella mucosa]|uniref:hypothetical protein n=1 Tax=Skermanella mucosa TaxID=1789672 RepID=UPI00192C943F|nr:hypothetical protein [Skermanella mucosa]UEM21321.1 hypothetical protein JL100_000590 [Skermanella mucosa]
MTDEKNSNRAPKNPGNSQPEDSRIKTENLGDARSDMGADDTTPENYGAEKAPNPGHPV